MFSILSEQGSPSEWSGYINGTELAVRIGSIASTIFKEIIPRHVLIKMDISKEIELFIDEFSLWRAPPPGQFSGGSRQQQHARLVGSIPLLTIMFYEHHGNGLPRMPGAHKGATQVIENGQYISVYG